MAFSIRKWKGDSDLLPYSLLVIFLPLSLVVPFLAWFLGEISGVFSLLLFWLVGVSILVLLVDYFNGVVWLKKKGLKIIEAILLPIRRNHQRYGGMMVHLGVILLSLGIIGLESLQQETQRTLALGEQVSLGRASRSPRLCWMSLEKINPSAHPIPRGRFI